NKSPEAPSPPAPAAAQPEQAAPAAAEAASVAAEPVETLPYFHACVPTISSGDHELFRVYLADNDLLVLRLGVGDVNLGNFQPRTKPRRTGGGRAGAMAHLADTKNLQLAKRIQDLDVAEEAGLGLQAAAANGGFIVG